MSEIYIEKLQALQILNKGAARLAGQWNSELKTKQSKSVSGVLGVANP